MRDQSQAFDTVHNYANGLFDEVFCNEISGPGVWWPGPISGGPMNYSGEVLFENAIAALGPLAGLVNNAGITGTQARVAEQQAADLTRLFAVNVVGTILCTGAAIRRLSTRHGGPGGAIINLASVAARTGGLPGIIPYAATKGAIETFTRDVANEVALEGIRVNAVSPGLIQTDMVSPALAESAKGGIPIGRLGQPEDIAEAVAFLLSPAAAYMTGSVVTVSGGR